MLYTVAQLGENTVRNIRGILCAEIDAYALGTDQFYNLLNLFKKNLGGILEQKVRFIEEEYHFGLGKITHFGHFFKEFRQKP